MKEKAFAAVNFLRNHRKLSLFLGIFLALVIFLNHYLVQPALFLYHQSQTLPRDLRPILTSLSRRDLETLNFELRYFRRQVVEIQKAGRRLGLFSFLPIVGGYLSDLNNVSHASLEAYDTGISLSAYLAPLLPNLNFLGWREGTTVPPNVAELTSRLPAISLELTKFKRNFQSIGRRLSSIDEQRYPETFRGRPIRTYLTQLKSLGNLSHRYFDELTELLSLAPQIMGLSKHQNYLVIVQNDKELRPGGGLLGGFALLEIENGNFKLVRSGDISFLDKIITQPRPPAPEFIQRLLGTRGLFLKDANYSPDFKKSARTIADLWLATPRAFELAGVAVVDTQFLKSLLTIFGDVRLEDGQAVNAENIEKTLNEFFAFVGDQSPQSRQSKNLVSIILNELLKKSFAYSNYNPQSLWQTLSDLGRAKHFLLYTGDEKLQRLAEKHNLSGEIKKYDGDYLHINDAVFSNSRSSWRVSQRINLKIEIRDQELLKELKIEYLGQPEGTSSAETSKTHFVRVYVPPGSRLLETQGTDETVRQSDDLGKTVFATAFKLVSGQKKTLTIKYRWPQPEIKKGDYKLLIQKQAGTPEFDYTVKINEQIENFKLSEDKEINVKI